MSRPPADIILSKELTNHCGLDILTAQGLYAVVYKLQPINIRQVQWNINGEKPKYVRTSYANQAPADNLAEKLNKEFFTNDFTVVKIL